MQSPARHAQQAQHVQQAQQVQHPQWDSTVPMLYSRSVASSNGRW